ncbi:MAG: diacylglycerol kinase family protein [Thermoleophilia bacterium]|nr:diacylglycerol kinase family protein [Thermoleophilia bacterium]
MLASFKWAFLGVATAIRQERHMRLHLLLAGLVGLLAVATRVSAVEAALLALAIGLVISLELVNSALEQALDAVAPERDPLVGRAKDMAAGAVLAAAVAAVVVAIAVFYDEFGVL